MSDARGERPLLICPDCGHQMIKTAMQYSDLSGWYVGWMCECVFDFTDQTIELVVFSERDWTAEQMLEAAGRTVIKNDDFNEAKRNLREEDKDGGV